jgi:hypothetical protein
MKHRRYRRHASGGGGRHSLNFGDSPSFLSASSPERSRRASGLRSATGSSRRSPFLTGTSSPDHSRRLIRGMPPATVGTSSVAAASLSERTRRRSGLTPSGQMPTIRSPRLSSSSPASSPSSSPNRSEPVKLAPPQKSRSVKGEIHSRIFSRKVGDQQQQPTRQAANGGQQLGSAPAPGTAAVTCDSVAMVCDKGSEGVTEKLRRGTEDRLKLLSPPTLENGEYRTGDF